MIYLDNAATSFPKPHAVYREIIKTMKKSGGNPGRGSHTLSRMASDALYDLREAAAEMFSCEVENVVLTYNATHALNLAIKGFAQAGSHILISDLEHNSVLRPVAALCTSHGCSYDVFKTHGGDVRQIIEELTHLVRDDTRMLVATHASNICNIRLPLRAIGKFCAAHGITFIVDASQSAGHTKISARNISADAICMPGHKGLYGPQGTGLLILKPGSRIGTIIEGGSGMNSLDVTMPDELPERLESGTLSAPLAAGLAAGIRFVNSVGIDVIRRHECEMGALTTNYLADMKGVTLYGSPFRHYGGVVLFALDGYTPAELGRALDKTGICVRSGLHCAPIAHRTLETGENGAVRVSFGYFNNAMHVRRLVDELYALTK